SDVCSSDLYAAISRGELRRSFDPRISEWGNPPSIAGTPRPWFWGSIGRPRDFKIMTMQVVEVLDFRLSREGMRLLNTWEVSSEPRELKHLSTWRKGHQPRLR